MKKYIGIIVAAVALLLALVFAFVASEGYDSEVQRWDNRESLIAKESLDIKELLSGEELSDFEFEMKVGICMVGCISKRFEELRHKHSEEYITKICKLNCAGTVLGEAIEKELKEEKVRTKI